MGFGIRRIRIRSWESRREERLKAGCGSGEDRWYRGGAPRTRSDEKVDVEFETTGSAQFTPNLPTPFHSDPLVIMGPVIVERSFHLDTNPFKAGY